MIAFRLFVSYRATALDFLKSNITGAGVELFVSLMVYIQIMT